MQLLPKQNPPKTLALDSSPTPNTKPHLPPPLQSLESHFSSLLSQISTSSAASQLVALSNRTQQVLRPFFQPTDAAFAHAAPLEVPARKKGKGGGMKTEDLKERFAGIPIYVLSDEEKNMMLVSGVKTGRSLGLLCFKEEDAVSLLKQMKAVNPGMHEGSEVVSVALNQVIKLKIHDVAFRFIPDSHQIVNAIKLMEQRGESPDGFAGVPVFLSRSLAMMSQNKRYRPAFLRKEDLEESLYAASQQQNYLNPALRKEDMQVCTLEDIITDMKENSLSKWSDVVFIPPGFDVSSHVGQEDGSNANA